MSCHAVIPSLLTTSLWLVSVGIVAAAPEPAPALAMRLLKTNCLSCHNDEKSKGSLKLTTRETLLQGGEDGVVLVPGKPEESALIKSLAAEADPHMPPKRQLSSAKIEVLRAWVAAGAPWDAAALAGQPSVARPVSLAALPASVRSVQTLALSPDGNHLAVGYRNELVLFDVVPNALTFRARASAHLDAVQSLAWTPDGKRLITGSFRRVVVWDAAALTPQREIIAGLTDRIMALKPLPNGQQVLLADGQAAETGIVRILDLSNGQLIRSWPAHDDTIFALALSSDGQQLATAGGDKLVKLWEVATGKELAKLEAHSTQVLSLAFNADQTQLVTAGADRQLKVWDVKTHENTIALATKTTSFNAVTWNATGPAVFAVTDEGVLLRYKDLKSHTGAQSSEAANERELGRTDAAFNCVVVSDNGERIFAGSSAGHLLSWDKDGKLLKNLDLMTIKSTP